MKRKIKILIDYVGKSSMSFMSRMYAFNKFYYSNILMMSYNEQKIKYEIKSFTIFLIIKFYCVRLKQITNVTY